MCRGVTGLTLARKLQDNGINVAEASVRLSWPEHLQNARLLGLCAPDQQGVALGLMGISLLLLAEDLLERESDPQAAGADRASGPAAENGGTIDRASRHGQGASGHGLTPNRLQQG